MRKIIILIALAVLTINVNSQYFIKAVNFKGTDAYVWKAGWYNGTDTKTTVTFQLFASELSSEALDNIACDITGAYSKDSVYLKVKQTCPFFQNAVLITVPFIQQVSDMFIPVSNDPIDSSIRVVEITGYKNNILGHSLTLDMNVHHSLNGSEFKITPIKWVVNNTDKYGNTDIGEYDFFYGYMKSNKLFINDVIIMGIGYGDGNDQYNQINAKEGYKWVNNTWIK